ncbi:hypothetical protein, partial [Pseudomonas koreensis]
GTAAKGQKVEVFDGATSKGQATADATTGEWRLTVSTLSVAVHSFTAKALYGSGAQSGARTFTVVAATAPTLTSVKGLPSNVEIPNGGITVEISAELGGTAAKGQKVEVFDGATSKGQATADATTGEWRLIVSALSAAAHSFTAKALYGSGEQSGARTFTVTAVVRPTLDYVLDTAGTNIVDGGTTTDTTLKVSGKASNGQQVEVFDGNGPSAVSKGIAPVNATTGDWQLTFTVPLGARRFAALSLYHATPTYSNVRTLTVTTAIPPSITSIRDSNGEVAENGETTSTLVTLQGRVTSGYQVQIHDNDVAKHTVTAVGEGWNTTLSVTLGNHSITAKAIATGQISNRRNFKVLSPIPPLVFNANPVTLNGATYLIPTHPHLLPVFDSGNSVRHQASGGVPGYIYTSSNQGVVVVDVQSGLVTVRGRGTATITVRDTANQSKSYNVTVAGAIYQCLDVGTGAWGAMNDKAISMGARLPTMNELRALHTAYGNRWPMRDLRYWSSESSGGKYHTKHVITGIEESVPDYYGAHTVGLQ